MKVAICQAPIAWEQPEKNRAIFASFFSLNQAVDLVVLPEMFTTGFTMQPSIIAETMNGPTVAWMKYWAANLQAAIVGSVVIKEKSKFYNRLLFITPLGEVTYYNKRHLFSLAGEDQVYTSGKQKKIVSFRGWKICLQICYDLRFPAFSRNTEDYDMLLYVANWPAPRIEAWNALLKARAIENMCYVVGVNRIGEDNTNQLYPGNSQVLNFMGEQVISPFEEEDIKIAQLDRSAMHQTRSKLGFLTDRDKVRVS